MEKNNYFGKVIRINDDKFDRIKKLSEKHNKSAAVILDKILENHFNKKLFE